MEKSLFFISKENFCFKKWTKKMSKNEKPRNTFEKTMDLLHILILASGHKKNNFKIVTINFKFFLKKEFRCFFC